jgi:hypothetical protein
VAKIKTCAAALALMLLLAGASMGAAPAVFDPSQSDPQAIALADLVMQTMGGNKAWEATRYLRFAFVVEKDGAEVARRIHLWDRHAGRLRYEAKDKAGHAVLALLNVRTRDGEAYRDGIRLEPGEARSLLDEAYEAWINDTYWLLMPYKMRDPGVHLRSAGEATENGNVYDLVLLTFQDVGLTPGDRYRAHINRKTHLMDRWSYILQDQPRDGPWTEWDWKGWRRVGGTLLCPEKVMAGKRSVRILHPILEVYQDLPDVYFTRPDPLPPRP